MESSANCRIELSATKALRHWNSLFVGEVMSQARKLAANSSHSETVTLLHYRQAAQIALKTLSVEILDGEQDLESQAA